MRNIEHSNESTPIKNIKSSHDSNHVSNSKPISDSKKSSDKKHSSERRHSNGDR